MGPIGTTIGPPTRVTLAQQEDAPAMIETRKRSGSGWRRTRRRLRAFCFARCEPLSEEVFWTPPPYPCGNSIGHLVLHTTGNLSDYIWSGTGYARNRPLEFTDSGRRATAAVLQALDDACAMVMATVRTRARAPAVSRRTWAAAVRRVTVACTVALLLSAWASSAVLAWGPQGHRLVALVAERHLTPAARQAVLRLLDGKSLADVAVWADDYRADVNQTGLWHYVNIPPAAKSYDRDRDCPRQPGVAAGSAGDAWRDCVVDRIRYNEERVANRMLDRADRALALKFLVHFVGDLHQPLHASAIERGGNGILVRVFGSDSCGDSGRPFQCNLHAAWDTQLIAHRGLNDSRYLALLETRVTRDRLMAQATGTPAEWAMESLLLSNAIMLPQMGEVDEAYYRRHLPSIDERLAHAGTRLAALLNRSLGGG